MKDGKPWEETLLYLLGEITKSHNSGLMNTKISLRNICQKSNNLALLIPVCFLLLFCCVVRVFGFALSHSSSSLSLCVSGIQRRIEKRCKGLAKRAVTRIWETNFLSQKQCCKFKFCCQNIQLQICICKSQQTHGTQVQ